jgi:hypothetical protein
LKRIPRNIIIASTSVVASLVLATTARAASYYWFGPTVPSPYTQAGANQWCNQYYNSMPWSVATSWSPTRGTYVAYQWKAGDNGAQIFNPYNIYADMYNRRCVAVTN